MRINRLHVSIFFNKTTRQTEKKSYFQQFFWGVCCLVASKTKRLRSKTVRQAAGSSRSGALRRDSRRPQNWSELRLGWAVQDSRRDAWFGATAKHHIVQRLGSLEGYRRCLPGAWRRRRCPPRQRLPHAQSGRTIRPQFGRAVEERHRVRAAADAARALARRHLVHQRGRHVLLLDQRARQLRAVHPHGEFGTVTEQAVAVILQTA